MPNDNAGLTEQFSRCLKVFIDLKVRIRSAHVRVVLSVNHERIPLHWQIVSAILMHPENEGWRASQ